MRLEGGIPCWNPTGGCWVHNSVSTKQNPWWIWAHQELHVQLLLSGGDTKGGARSHPARCPLNQHLSDPRHLPLPVPHVQLCYLKVFNKANFFPPQNLDKSQTAAAARSQSSLTYIGGGGWRKGGIQLILFLDSFLISLLDIRSCIKSKILPHKHKKVCDPVQLFKQLSAIVLCSWPLTPF